MRSGGVVEAGHHSGLLVVGAVAVQHPDAGLVSHEGDGHFLRAASVSPPAIVAPPQARRLRRTRSKDDSVITFAHPWCAQSAPAFAFQTHAVGPLVPLLAPEDSTGRSG